MNDEQGGQSLQLYMYKTIEMQAYWSVEQCGDAEPVREFSKSNDPILSNLGETLG